MFCKGQPNSSSWEARRRCRGLLGLGMDPLCKSNAHLQSQPAPLVLSHSHCWAALRILSGGRGLEAASQHPRPSRPSCHRTRFGFLGVRSALSFSRCLIPVAVSTASQDEEASLCAPGVSDPTPKSRGCLFVHHGPDSLWPLTPAWRRVKIDTVGSGR